MLLRLGAFTHFGIVLGSSVWSGSRPFLPGRRLDSLVPDKNFGTGTRTATDCLYWSGPGPDLVPGACTFYLFIYSRSRTAGSCGMAWRRRAQHTVDSGAAMRGRLSMGEDPDRQTLVSFPRTTRGAGSHRAGIQSGWDMAVWPHAWGQRYWEEGPVSVG